MNNLRLVLIINQCFDKMKKKLLLILVEMLTITVI